MVFSDVMGFISTGISNIIAIDLGPFTVGALVLISIVMSIFVMLWRGGRK
jgi:hypothetical protein